MNKTHRIGVRRMVVAAIGLLAIGATWWQLSAPTRELTVRRGTAGPTGEAVPVTYLVRRETADPAGGAAGGVPGVVIAHGFASAQNIMMGYAYTLAYAGYGVALLDFGGHGANPRRLDDTRGTLQEDIDVALAYLIEQPEVDPERIAIVGHSMGSGAAMQAGIRRADLIDAVVAISPTDAPVTGTQPRNLQLQAGTWETRFVENARRLLEGAGGAATEAASFDAGTARELVLVPNAEHISILFRATSHDAVLRWMTRTFDDVPRASDTEYTDRRPLLALVQVLGWIALAWGLGPLIRAAVPRATGRGREGLPAIRARWWVAGMVGGPVAATGTLALLSMAGPIGEIGGMLVAGPVAIWFLVAGLLWLAVGFRPGFPSGRSLLLGVGLFAFLWVGVGLVAQHLAFRWLLVPSRLARWPLASIALIPWFLASGLAQHRASTGQRFGLYVVQILVVVAGLAVAGIAVPGLYIIVLVLPAMPVILAITATAGGIVSDPWAYATGNALFLGWLLAALFPLAG